MKQTRPIPLMPKAGLQISAILGVLVLASCCFTTRVNNAFVVPASEATWKSGVFRIRGLRADQKLAALTIDDSPSDQTRDILRLLERHRSKATFFMHGRVLKKEDWRLVRDIVAAGHEVGNHMPVGSPTVFLSPQEFASEFKENDKILRSAGAEPSRFRPSHAFWNDHMKRFLDSQGVRMGYRPNFYLGTYPPWDLAIDDPEAYAAHLGSCPSPGSIMVFHDNNQKSNHNGRTRTVAGLDAFLEGLKNSGFRATSLEEIERLARMNAQTGITQVGSASR